jgi:hypothetical protein
LWDLYVLMILEFIMGYGCVFACKYLFDTIWIGFAVCTYVVHVLFGGGMLSALALCFRLQELCQRFTLALTAPAMPTAQVNDTNNIDRKECLLLDYRIWQIKYTTKVLYFKPISEHHSASMLRIF